MTTFFFAFGAGFLAAFGFFAFALGDFFFAAFAGFLVDAAVFLAFGAAFAFFAGFVGFAALTGLGAAFATGFAGAFGAAAAFLAVAAPAGAPVAAAATVTTTSETAGFSAGRRPRRRGVLSPAEEIRLLLFGPLPRVDEFGGLFVVVIRLFGAVPQRVAVVLVDRPASVLVLILIVRNAAGETAELLSLVVAVEGFLVVHVIAASHCASCQNKKWRIPQPLNTPDAATRQALPHRRNGRAHARTPTVMSFRR